MQTFKTHSKYFIIAALTLSIVWGVFAQVSIPTGLTNAIQYIMQTVWTDDGTDSGLVNVQIDNSNIYVRTWFLSDGTGWNNKALGVDSWGNVVYVTTNGNISNPLNLPQANYIPKINALWDDLEISKLFQLWWMVWVNTLNPAKTLDILWSFQVMTQWSLFTYTYQFYQTSPSSNTLSILQTLPCSCENDINNNECSTATSPRPSALQTDPAACFDITGQDPNDTTKYFYDIYSLVSAWVADPVLVTSGTSVGIGTNNPNPNYDLHVSWNWALLVESILKIWDISTTPNVSNATLSFPNPTWPFTIRAQTNNPPGLPRNVVFSPWCILTTQIQPFPLPPLQFRFCMYGASARVWIGITNPQERLDVGWDIRYVNATALSDITLKKNINNITNALGTIASLQGISYEWKATGEDAFEECEIGVNEEGIEWYICDEETIEFPTWVQFGFSAQALELVVPELVKTDENWLKSVNYNGMVPILLQAIKEQQTMIQELEWRIYILENGPLE